ncbi:sulfotransferase [bacterium]|nr:sulfotransferase [bacterium]
MLKAAGLQRSGNLEAAKVIYKDILAVYPSNIKAKNALKKILNEEETSSNRHVKFETKLMAMYNSGNHEAVTELSSDIGKDYPDSANIWNIIGASQVVLGLLGDAILSFKKSTTADPTCYEGFKNLGFCYQRVGNIEQAIESYESALSLKPDYFDALNNLGVALRDQGNFRDAISVHERATKINSNNISGLLNLGVAYREAGRLSDALLQFEFVLILDENNAKAYNNIATVRLLQGELQEAELKLQKALMLRPDYIEAINNLGVLYLQSDNFDEALGFFKKALAKRPSFIDAWSNAAEAMEKWNKIRELNEWIISAENIFETLPIDLKYYKAKALWRSGEKDKASDLVAKISWEDVKPSLRQNFLELSGRCLDFKSQYHEAYKKYQKMNALNSSSKDLLKFDRDQYLDKCRNNLNALDAKVVETNNSTADIKGSFFPVFIVGFPRSGTTLLDTILRSHSDIQVIEEQPMLYNTRKYLLDSGFDCIRPWQLDSDTRQLARAYYEAQLLKFVDFSSVVVDKFPLNIIDIPLINAIYPEARFVVAIRHPLDVIWSCWTQNFQLNSAMANMLDLHKASELYDLAMSIYFKSKFVLNIKYHEIKYEKLVDNFELEVSHLLGFLELPWQEQVIQYHKVAIDRDRIATPSYSQVIEPIYRTSKYKWMNYQDFLQPHANVLDKWIREFRYD